MKLKTNFWKLFFKKTLKFEKQSSLLLKKLNFSKQLPFIKQRPSFAKQLLSIKQKPNFTKLFFLLTENEKPPLYNEQNIKEKFQINSYAKRSLA